MFTPLEICRATIKDNTADVMVLLLAFLREDIDEPIHLVCQSDVIDSVVFIKDGLISFIVDR